MASNSESKAFDAMSAMVASFQIHSLDDEIKHAIYDWKRKLAGKQQNVVLEHMLSSDTVQNIWDMLPLRDVFALTFVSQHIREQNIERMRRIKYVTSRSRVILTHILGATVKHRTPEFLEMMRDHGLYIGGSSILHGILYERPDITPWESSDLDVYVKTVAGFSMLKPKLDEMFTSGAEKSGEDYGSWFYGSWKVEKEGHKFSVNVDEASVIDIISADHGIECYDFTICQNNIDWEGKMRCINAYDIVHGEIQIANLFGTHLKEMLAYTGLYHENDHIHITGNIRQMSRNLVARIKKYKSRGFTLITPILKYFNISSRILSEFLDMLKEESLSDVLLEEISQVSIHGGVSRYCDNLSCSTLNCLDYTHYDSVVNPYDTVRAALTAEEIQRLLDEPP